MAGLRERFERGQGMRAQRAIEGALLVSYFVLGDLTPAAVAFAMLLAQAAITPFAAPIALAWAIVDRRPAPAGLSNLYHDLAAVRGSAAVSAVVLAVAFVLVYAGLPTAGRILVAAPAASCLLSATVGFCAGCGIYVVARDFAARHGLAQRPPRGASDVDVQ